MSQVGIIASTSVNAEASQIIGTINSWITGASGPQVLLSPTGAGPLGNINIPSVTSAINLVTLTAGASGSPAQVSVGGPSSSTNAGLQLSAANASGQTLLGGQSVNSAALIIAGNATATNGLLLTAGQSGSPTTLVIGGSSADANQSLIIAGVGTGTVALGGAGNSLARAGLLVAGVASTVNVVQISSAVSGSAPIIQVTGSSGDANAGLIVAAIGTGNVGIGGASTLAGAGLTVAGVTANVDGITITGSSTGGTAVTIAATGSDTNLNLKLSAKGTGQLMIGVSSMLTASGAVAMSTANSLPTGTTSSTPVKYLTLVDPAGTIKYQIPLWA